MARKLINLLWGIAVTLLALELLLRLMPVLHGWENPPISADNPVIRDYPGASYTYSHDWDFRNHVDGHFNNLGFPSAPVNIHDPTIVIIGDSYVEAAMISPDERQDQVLAKIIRRPVTALGMANTSLPDYMVVADWAVHNLRVSALVFELSPGDLSESVEPRLRGYWYEPLGDALVLNHSAKFTVRNVLMKSRLFDYLYYNLRFSPQTMFKDWQHPQGAVFDEAQPTPGGDPQEAGISPLMQHSTKRFVSDALILRGRGIPVVIVIDPNIQNIYAGRSGNLSETQYVGQIARTAGLQVLDLTQAFRRDYQTHGKMLDFGSVDVHWNARAHAVTAQALAALLGKGH